MESVPGAYAVTVCLLLFSPSKHLLFLYVLQMVLRKNCDRRTLATYATTGSYPESTVHQDQYHFYEGQMIMLFGLLLVEVDQWVMTMRSDGGEFEVEVQVFGTACLYLASGRSRVFLCEQSWEHRF